MIKQLNALIDKNIKDKEKTSQLKKLIKKRTNVVTTVKITSISK